MSEVSSGLTPGRQPREVPGYGSPRFVGPYEAVARGIRGAFDVSGRATRAEYWWFALFFTLWYFSAAVVDAALGWQGWLVAGVALAFVCPLLSLGARRLHDQNKSGWLQLLVLVPFLGSVILLGLFCVGSMDRPNQWGPALTS